MVALSTSSARTGATNAEALQLLLKRPWDPASSILTQHKPVSVIIYMQIEFFNSILYFFSSLTCLIFLQKKLPANPIFLMIPSGPPHLSAVTSKRMKFWSSHLAYLSKVVPITLHQSQCGHGVNVTQCLDNIINVTRQKVCELRSNMSDKPIVLVGWNIGALVACHISLVEHVTAIICLGFPVRGVEGTRMVRF